MSCFFSLQAVRRLLEKLEAMHDTKLRLSSLEVIVCLCAVLAAVFVNSGHSVYEGALAQTVASGDLVTLELTIIRWSSSLGVLAVIHRSV